jgi:hypothetical protein
MGAGAGTDWAQRPWEFGSLSRLSACMRLAPLLRRESCLTLSCNPPAAQLWQERQARMDDEHAAVPRHLGVRHRPEHALPAKGKERGS